MLSIITVCYNAERVIARTIESVLIQNNRNYEYIFIDGNSNDKTLDIINKYSIKLKKIGITVKLISESDFGIYDAMNKGISLAKGEWVNFLNAGDVYCTENILTRVEQCMNKKNEDIFVGQVINCEGYLGRRFLIDKLEILEKQMIFCHQSMFIKKELFRNKLFDLKYRYSADYEWTLYMYKRGYKFSYMDFPIVFYDSTGVSNVNRDKTIDEARRIQAEYGYDKNIGTVSEQTNIKGRLYRYIAHNKVLAYMFYKMMVHKKNDVFWLGENK